MTVRAPELVVALKGCMRAITGAKASSVEQKVGEITWQEGQKSMKGIVLVSILKVDTFKEDKPVKAKKPTDETPEKKKDKNK